jgi:signal transduction histidine kinase
MVLLSRASYVLLVLGAVGTVFLALRSADAEKWVKHTIEVRSRAGLLINDLQDAIIRARGFLLTGDETHLGNFTQLFAGLKPRISRLQELVVDNPEQGIRLQQVSDGISSLERTLNQTIALVRAGKRDAAVDVVRSAKVQQRTRALSHVIDEFIEAEQSLLIHRQEQAASLQNMLLLLIGLGLALAALLSVLLERSTRHFVDRLRARSTELEEEIQRRRDTEATLQQSQKMEAIGQLTGGIAHDFNNLLTIIIGNLDTLKRTVARLRTGQSLNDLSDRLERQTEMALQAARNAAKLTHRLLAFARRQPLEPSHTDCNRLISGMSELLTRTLGETINLETVLGGGLWTTFADANQLESALLNLAVNAQHAMPNGGHLTIETANAYLDEGYARRFGDIAPGQYVMLSITDTGTGIPRDILDRVFEPFFTTKAPEAGSGLGLAMVHGFVKQSGGHLRLYSEVGHGTTVKIYLPRQHDAEEVAATPSGSPVSALAMVPAKAGESILVVEDNDGVRDYACSVLRELGYKVHEAANAADAIALIEKGCDVDLLFTDVVLPGGVSGRQLADKVRQLNPALPVLFTTGYTRNAIVHHGRLDPGVQLLNKPYSQQELAQKISELLS